MFACRLALALGVPNPYELLRELPANVWLLWQAYAALEPWRVEDEPARTYGGRAKPAQVASTLIDAMKAHELVRQAKANGI